MGQQRPNEAIGFESALTSTPDITLQRGRRRKGPKADVASGIYGIDTRSRLCVKIRPYAQIVERGHSKK